MLGYETIMKKRSRLDLINGVMANFAIQISKKSNWGKYRKFPTIAKQSFSKQYRRKKK